MFLVAVIGDNLFSYSLLEFPSQLAMDYAQDIAFRIWFFFFFKSRYDFLFSHIHTWYVLPRFYKVLGFAENIFLYF